MSNTNKKPALLDNPLRPASGHWAAQLTAGIREAHEIPRGLADVGEDVRRRFLDQGVEPAGGSPAQFSDHVKAEIAKWAKVVKDANIQPE